MLSDFSIPAQFASIFMLLFVAFNMYQQVWNNREVALHDTLFKISTTAFILFITGMLCESLIKDIMALS